MMGSGLALIILDYQCPRDLLHDGVREFATDAIVETWARYGNWLGAKIVRLSEIRAYRGFILPNPLG